MVLGNKIKKLRELKNFTQEYMSEKLQVSQPHYSRIESNEVDVPFSKLEQIASVLDIKVSDLVEFDSKFFFNNIQATTSNIGTFQQSPELIESYKEQVELLKKENEYLKKVIDGFLNK